MKHGWGMWRDKRTGECFENLYQHGEIPYTDDIHTYFPRYNRIGQRVELKDYLMKNSCPAPADHMTEEAMLQAALKNYEAANNLKPSAARVDVVKNSAEGIEGWATGITKDGTHVEPPKRQEDDWKEKAWKELDLGPMEHR